MDSILSGHKADSLAADYYLRLRILWVCNESRHLG